MNAALPHTRKEPAPAPAWVRIFRDSVVDDRLDERTPSRRAYLVADELTAPTSSPADRARIVHRFAVGLDLAGAVLYEIERTVSPLAPIETSTDAIERRLRAVMHGGAGGSNI